MSHLPGILSILVAANVLTLFIYGWAAAQSLARSANPPGIILSRPEWYEDESPPCWYENPGDESINRWSGAYIFRAIARELPYFQSMHAPELLADTHRFVYQITIRNSGNKTIESIDWDYIFIHPETQAEVGRRQFHTEEKIRPYKRTSLIEYSRSPPTKVISITALSQPESNRFIEKVVIRRVTYEDGIDWQNPSPLNLRP